MILVIMLAWAVSAEEPILLPLLSDALDFSPVANEVPLGALLISLIAFILLAARRTSVLDLWVMVAIFGMALEQALASFFVQTRFSFGWYSMRILAVAVSTIVLIALISETVMLYSVLVKANRSLQREHANKLLNARAAIAATIHQLTQPLAAIRFSSAAAKRLLSHAPQDIDEIQRAHANITSAVSHANEILESMRALFEDTDLPHTLVSVNELVAESLRAVRNELEENRITASTQLARDLPLIAGHKGQLEEVVLNLVHNSVDAIGPSEKPTPKLDCRKAARWQGSRHLAARHRSRDRTREDNECV